MAHQWWVHLAEPGCTGCVRCPQTSCLDSWLHAWSVHCHDCHDGHWAGGLGFCKAVACFCHWVVAHVCLNFGASASCFMCSYVRPRFVLQVFVTDGVARLKKKERKREKKGGQGGEKRRKKKAEGKRRKENRSLGKKLVSRVELCWGGCDVGLHATAHHCAVRTSMGFTGTAEVNRAKCRAANNREEMGAEGGGGRRFTSVRPPPPRCPCPPGNQWSEVYRGPVCRPQYPNSAGPVA